MFKNKNELNIIMQSQFRKQLKSHHKFIRKIYNIKSRYESTKIFKGKFWKKSAKCWLKISKTIKITSKIH